MRASADLLAIELDIHELRDVVGCAPPRERRQPVNPGKRCPWAAKNKQSESAGVGLLDLVVSIRRADDCHKRQHLGSKRIDFATARILRLSVQLAARKRCARVESVLRAPTQTPSGSRVSISARLQRETQRRLSKMCDRSQSHLALFSGCRGKLTMLSDGSLGVMLWIVWNWHNVACKVAVFDQMLCWHADANDTACDWSCAGY